MFRTQDLRRVYRNAGAVVDRKHKVFAAWECDAHVIYVTRDTVLRNKFKVMSLDKRVGCLPVLMFTGFFFTKAQAFMYAEIVSDLLLNGCAWSTIYKFNYGYLGIENLNVWLSVLLNDDMKGLIK